MTDRHIRSLADSLKRFDCTHTHIITHARTRAHTYMHTHVHAQAHPHTYTHKHANTHTHTHTRCKSVHVHRYIYIQRYIYTHASVNLTIHIGFCLTSCHTLQFEEGCVQHHHYPLDASELPLTHQTVYESSEGCRRCAASLCWHLAAVRRDLLAHYSGVRGRGRVEGCLWLEKMYCVCA